MWLCEVRSIYTQIRFAEEWLEDIFHIPVITHKFGHKRRSQAQVTCCCPALQDTLSLTWNRGRTVTLVWHRESERRREKQNIFKKADVRKCSREESLQLLQGWVPRPHRVLIWPSECTEGSEDSFIRVISEQLNESLRAAVNHQHTLGVCVCVDSPFLCLVNNVTDLHVERPVLILQGPIGGLLCDKHITVINLHTNTHKTYIYSIWQLLLSRVTYIYPILDPGLTTCWSVVHHLNQWPTTSQR